LAGDDPVPVKFGPKGTDPNTKDARLTFHTQSAVQSPLADLLVYKVEMCDMSHKCRQWTKSPHSLQN